MTDEGRDERGRVQCKTDERQDTAQQMKATMKTNGSKVEQTKVKTKDDSATDEGKGRWNQCRTDKGQYGRFLET